MAYGPQAAGLDPQSVMGPARPDQTDNRVDGHPRSNRKKTAKRVAEFHRKGLSRKREHDLTAEKYLLHIDGEGDNQWADVLDGQRVAIPPSLSGTPRQQHNLLRPIVNNQIAYHTTHPFEMGVEAPEDRESREAARMDKLWINQLMRRQRWNALFAESMGLACAYGSCPIHAYWRDDLATDPYEPLYLEGEEVQNPPRSGHVDCWVGDPWDTVYNAGATRSSVHWAQYGRTLPADMVRRAFSQSLEAQGVKLEGNDKLPSSARFQRTARKWAQTSLNRHGTSALWAGEETQEEEQIALICREKAPGIDREWPDGRLTIVALQGASSTDDEEVWGGGLYGDPVLLHDGPLPGGTLSFVRVYSHHRFDDVLGKPFVADIDDLQVQLNQYYTLLAEYTRRAARAPWAVPTGSEINMETAYWDWDAMIEYDPMPGGSSPPIDVLSPPGEHIEVVQSMIEQLQASMYRIGGWQAASRGEADSGDSGKKVIALAKYDDTIHGPTNQRFRETVEEFAGVCWQLAKEYMDVPQRIETTGDETAYLSDSWVDRTQLSERPPQFKLLSGFGATPEAQSEQLLSLMQTQDPVTGEPLLSAEQVRKRWPDNTTFPDGIADAQDVRERRPKQVGAALREQAEQVARRMQVPQDIPLTHPQVQRMAWRIHQQIATTYPLLPDDDLQAHMEELSTYTQDETEHGLVRAVAMMRQRQYQQMMAQRQMQAMQAREQAQDGDGGGNEAPSPREAFRPSAGGTTTAEAGEQADAREEARQPQMSA